MRDGGSAGEVVARAEEAFIAVPARIPRVLSDRYRLERLLAKGGNGRVYRAIQLPLGRPVAIKMLVARPGDVEFRERFFLEASTSARLVHRHIVTVHDYGETEDGELFMAMELLDGELLSDVIAKHRRLPSDRVCRIALQVCRALRAAHAHGVVHRDLKPANIMLVRDEGDDLSEEEALVKVLDFGLLELFGEAAATRPGASISRPERLLGTPPYMAPEQIRGEPADPRTDVYALGAILFHMLTGAPPFSGSNLEIIDAHLAREPQRPSEVAPDAGIWPELDAIVLRALAKAREARFGSMHELLGALKAVYLRATSLALSSGEAGRVTDDLLELREISPTPPATLVGPDPRELGLRPPASSRARVSSGPTAPAEQAEVIAPPPLGEAPGAAAVMRARPREALRASLSLGLAIGIAILVLLGLRALMLPGVTH